MKWYLAILSLFCASWLQVCAQEAHFDLILSRTKPNHDSKPIPKVVHFVYGLKDGPSPSIEFYQFLCLQSALISIQPVVIYLWVYIEPQGEWWEEIKKLDKVQVKQLDRIDRVYGRKLEKFAHWADIVRLKVLHEFGGIYLDLDVLALRSFDSLLEGNSFVLGQEGQEVCCFLET